MTFSIIDLEITPNKYFFLIDPIWPPSNKIPTLEQKLLDFVEFLFSL
jgi:hypothetical protein